MPMTWLFCTCGHSLATRGDFAYAGHFFAASDWQEAGDQILDAMSRLLAADAHATAADDEDESLADEDTTGVVYACDHCGRHWLRLPAKAQVAAP
jgi:hypothetical protein